MAVAWMSQAGAAPSAADRPEQPRQNAGRAGDTDRAASPAAPRSISGLRVSRQQLANGLTILLAQEHSQPLVSVTAWYRVGARNERPGISGIAHFLEHMAFRATESLRGEDMMGLMERLGGHAHGYTTLDNTAYYETVRREALESLLFLEAERMQRCLIRPDEVDAERGSVLSELKGYENDPWSLLFDDLAAVAFREHPYGYNIVGWVSDLEAITREDLVEFYRRHYVPSNAILTVVGDFDSRQALAAARRHFGSLPRRPRLEPLRTVEAPQRGERRLKLRLPGSAAHIMVAHHAPALGDPDFFAFYLLDGILSGGRDLSTLPSGFEISPRAADRRTSRLYRALIATGLASRVGSGFAATLHPYLHTVTAEAAPGADPGALESAIIGALEAVTREAPSEEKLDSARGRLLRLTQLESDTYAEIGQILAMQEASGSPERWERIEERLSAVKPADVQAAARRYFHADNRTIGRFEPRPEPAAETRAAGGRAAEGNASPAASGEPARQATEGPASAGAGALAESRASGSVEEGASAGSRPSRSAAASTKKPEVKLSPLEPPPPPERKMLPSGLLLVASENPWVSTAALVAEADAGPYFDLEGEEGSAALTARLLASGSTARDAGATAAAIDRLGMRWQARIGGTELEFPDPRRIRIEVELAAGDLEEAAALLAASLSAPLFPAAELRTARQAQISEVAALEDDTEGLARSGLLRSLYAGTPHGRPPLGTGESVAALGRADLLRFHAARYRPQRVRIAFAGGRPAGEALAELERAFAGWLPGPEEGAPEAAGADAGSTAPMRGRLTSPQPVRLMHKTRADLAYGFFTGVAPGSPDHLAFEALAFVLHHNYGGRLGDLILNQRGLAYSIDSQHAPELPGSPWLLTTGSPPEKVETLRGVWEGVLDEAAWGGISARELAEAKTYLQGRRLHERETNLDAARAALAALRGGSDGAPDPSRLSLDEVNRLARTLLGNRQAIWSLAGPLP